MPQQFYEDEEAEAILRLAAQKVSVGGMSRERLLATAAELGITPEAVEEAERTITRTNQRTSLRAEFDKDHRKDFFSHLAVFTIVNGFLFFMNLVTNLDSHGDQAWWVLYPLLGWGIGLALHFRETFFKGTSDYEEEFDKWLERRGEKDSPDNRAASQLAADYLAINPGDVDGAAQYVRNELKLKKRQARTAVGLAVRARK